MECKNRFTVLVLLKAKHCDKTPSKAVKHGDGSIRKCWGNCSLVCSKELLNSRFLLVRRCGFIVCNTSSYIRLFCKANHTFIWMCFFNLLSFLLNYMNWDLYDGRSTEIYLTFFWKSLSSELREGKQMSHPVNKKQSKYFSGKQQWKKQQQQPYKRSGKQQVPNTSKNKKHTKSLYQ